MTIYNHPGTPGSSNTPDDRDALSRIIPFEGGVNFRELGGYPVADGRHVRHGLLYRGGTLNDLRSSRDRAALRKLDLRLIIDLRSAGEREVSPDYVPPHTRYFPASAIRYNNGDEVDFSPEGMRRLRQEIPDVDALPTTGILKNYYARMPFNNPAFKELFDAMEKGEVPLLFHCTAGKDRTGVAAMLILLALGADRETAVFDYMETNRCRSGLLRGLEENHRYLRENNPEEWELLVIQFGVLQKFADAALDAIMDKYSSPEEYFDREYGLDSRRLQALRDKYLE